MQHVNSTGSKQERARTWDCVLARFSMPALEKLYNISSKVEAARLCLIFIANGRRISRSWSEIEDSPEHKKASELRSMQCRMLKLTKFLGLHNEFFSQNIPIQNSSLMRIHIIFQVNVLSIPEVISFEINRVGSLNCTPLESIFKILIITLISALMCPSVKIQKNALNKVTGRFGTCIPRWLK